MKKENYSLIDISMMTGFTTRTIRTYIKNGLLSGSKKDGTWIFTEDEVVKFFNEKFIKEGIQIKDDALVKDFINNRQKSENSACSVLDYLVKNNEEVERLCDKMIEKVNSSQNCEIKFSFSYDNRTSIVRVTVTGNMKSVMNILREL